MKTDPDCILRFTTFLDRLSLAFRLALFYTLATASLILMVTGFLYVSLTKKLDQEDTQFLADKVFVLRSILSKRPGNSEALHEEVDWEGAARRFTKFYVRILDPGGGVIMESGGMPPSLRTAPFPPPIPPGVLPRESRLIRVGRGSLYRTISAWAAESAGTKHALVEVALDQTEEERLLRLYRETVGMVLIAGILLSAALGYLLARRGMAPLTEVISAIEGIRSLRHPKRLPTAGLPMELVTLADSFNEMLDRLEESFDRLSQFSADLAHELRTPINNLRGEAEVALLRDRKPEDYRQVLESGLEELGRLSRMIDSLLFLAREESARSVLSPASFDARREAEKIGSFFEPYAEEKGVRITIHGSATLLADRDLYQRALANILENGLKNTPGGGEIVLTLRTGDSFVEVTVADTGCGIASEHLPRVFDRFYRADPAREHDSGSMGLGLALVRSIMTLHQGSVEIRSEIGRGTTVRLRFPVRALPST